MLKQADLGQFSYSNDVREVLPGLGEPPVAKEEAEQAEQREIGQAVPIRERAFQHDAPITSNESGKWI